MVLINMKLKIKDEYFESFDGLLLLLSDLKKYILKLEKENEKLKKQITKIKKETNGKRTINTNHS